MGKIDRDGVAGLANKKTAAQWFLRSARQGYAKAQNHIGMRYALGDGIKSDEIRALMWLTIAANRGNKLAEVNRSALTQKMMPSQIVKALDLAKTWQPISE